MRKITDKQKRFVDEYMIDLNATQACIRAGYKPKNADKMGYELLGKTLVSKEIAKRKKEIRERSGITVDEIIKDLKELKDFDITSILGWDVKAVKTGVRINDNNEPEDIYEYKRLMEIKPPEEVNGKLIKKISISDKGSITIEGYDRLSAIDKLMKHLGMGVEKVKDGEFDLKEFAEVLKDAYSEKKDD